MEELFQYMKTLRTQINDVADQAAKISVEEHMYCTTINNLRTDVDLVKREGGQVKEEIAQIVKQKGEVCSQILEKQRKLALLESDSSTLNQTLELMQQEKLSLTAKLLQSSAYYSKVLDDICDRLNAYKEQINAEVTENASVGKVSRDDVGQPALLNLQAARTKFDKMQQLISDIVSENDKRRLSLELVKNTIAGFQKEVGDMEGRSLEEELHALKSDKAGVAEYEQSLQLQISRLKEISHTIRCSCGEEYKVNLGTYA